MTTIKVIDIIFLHGLNTLSTVTDMQLFGNRISVNIYPAMQFVPAARDKEPQNLIFPLIKAMDTGKPKIMPLINQDFKDIHQDNSRQLCYFCTVDPVAIISHSNLFYSFTQ